MWSNVYWYYEIRKDDEYSQVLPPEEVVNVLINTKIFNKIGPQSFENKNDSPFIKIDCVYRDDQGGWSHRVTDSTEFCNIISIIVSKIGEIIEPHYINTLVQIAQELNWELILEEDDNGNQNIALYLL